LAGSAFKTTANYPYNFTKFNSSVERKEFKEMTSQSQARTLFASSHCSLYFLPHFQRGSFPLPISSAEFVHRQPKTSPFPPIKSGSSAHFVWQFLSIPTHHPKIFGTMLIKSYIQENNRQGFCHCNKHLLLICHSRQSFWHF